MSRADWRFPAIGGATAGVALSPLAGSAPGTTGLITVLAAALVLALTMPAAGTARAVWVCLVALVGFGAGVTEGSARLASMADGALRGQPGTPLTVTATVEAVPRRVKGAVRVRARAPGGRLLLEAREPVPDLPVGSRVRAAGRLIAPPPWAAGYLRRNGIGMVLAARRIEPAGGRRSGWRGAVDAIRGRAESALGRSVPRREAALARGFVLGQDDRIDQQTVEDFKRSGLAHLLAVSGENVLLLALLAAPILGLAGIGIRARLACILVLIGVYVAVTGAGPSIQRAGVMGAAGVIAALAGRPRSRAYAVLLAALVTLGMNPLASGDPGWQLSFAAVLGIVLWAGPFRALWASLLPRAAQRGAIAGLLLEGAGITTSATLATAPLMAHTFEVVPAASLPANLLALPAVAPSMWLGMLAAMGGQVPGVPVEPFNWLNSLLLAYIAQVAEWCAAPAWALVPARIGSWMGVAVAYAVMAGALAMAIAAARRRAALAGASTRRPPPWSRPLALGAALLLAAALLGPAGLTGKSEGRPDGDTFMLELLDVGQGDAILLRPPDGAPVLVDGGPHGGKLPRLLEERGVEHLAGAVVTHDQEDHAGGIEEVLGTVSTDAVLYADPPRDVLAAANAARVRSLAIAEGSEVRSGSLKLQVLWPPRDQPAAPGEDPNSRAIVLLARWGHFTALLTGDAEAEAVPVEPGPVDVLKVAHHGSADAGLDHLLERTAPRLALISVGAGNSYGHPTPETLGALAQKQVPVLRTDRDGSVRIVVSRQGWSVDAAD